MSKRVKFQNCQDNTGKVAAYQPRGARSYNASKAFANKQEFLEHQENQKNYNNIKDDYTALKKEVRDGLKLK